MTKLIKNWILSDGLITKLVILSSHYHLIWIKVSLSFQTTGLPDFVGFEGKWYKCIFSKMKQIDDA